MKKNDVCKCRDMKFIFASTILCEKTSGKLEETFHTVYMYMNLQETLYSLSECSLDVDTSNYFQLLNNSTKIKLNLIRFVLCVCWQVGSILRTKTHKIELKFSMRILLLIPYIISGHMNLKMLSELGKWLSDCFFITDV